MGAFFFFLGGGGGVDGLINDMGALQINFKMILDWIYLYKLTQLIIQVLS